MKLNVSLPRKDVEFLDEYAASVGAPSRSAVIQRAVRLLRASGLSAAYENAWQEWVSSEDPELWEFVVNDGSE